MAFSWEPMELLQGDRTMSGVEWGKTVLTLDFLPQHDPGHHFESFE